VHPAPSALPGDGSRRPARLIVGALLGLLLAIQVSQGVRVASLPPIQLVSWNVIIDDGFYYLQVARNLARGHGSTFDRVSRTNGYQPLWAAMLVPIFWFCDDAAVGLRAAIVLATLLGAASVLLVFVGLQRLVGLGAALLACAVLVANPYFLQILQGGLETPALFFCLAGLLAFWAYRGERVLAGERWPCLQLGAILGLIVLARTDVALGLLPFGLVLLLAGPGSAWARLRRALLVAGPAAALLAPFSLWSLITQGSPVPVSGLVKRWVAATFTPTRELWYATEQWRGLTRTLHLLAWPHRVSAPELLAQVAPALKYPAALLAFLALRLAWSRRARANRLSWLLAGAAATGLTLHALYLFFIYRSTGHWNYHYFFPAALLFTLVAAVAAPLLVADLGLLVDRLLLRGRLRAGFAALAAALTLPAVAALVHRGLGDFELHMHELRKPPAESFRKSRWDAAEHMRSFPQDEVFGSWWAGTLGYLSDRRVMNLDGVVNSGAFFRDVLRTNSVPRWLQQRPVPHLVDFFWHNPLTGGPSWRAMWWEHEKEHIVWQMRSKLRVAATFPFQGEAGMYIFDLKR
jgi:4-amino-4-deoxy-L-arabinose transferase-like glycosyltransferase